MDRARMTTDVHTAAFDMNLASLRLRAAVVAASDDYFAEKENLLKSSEPVFLPLEYTDRGKWMDGWESRRKRSLDYERAHDWAIVRLGVPGVIRAIGVDTAFFRGNFPSHCSLEGCAAPTDARPDELAAPETEWVEILPKSALRGDAKNAFTIDSPYAFSHVRLNIFPDGGVARLRVHGNAVPDYRRQAQLHGEVDLAAADLGADVVVCSDMFFGERRNLIMPDRALNMGDGWETRRRRGPGSDWAIVSLAARGSIERVLVDTHHFKGNFPDSCSIDVCDTPLATADALVSGTHPWRPLLAPVRLQADARHWFQSELSTDGPVTHARLNVFPDGGVSRLRLYGSVSEADRKELGLRRLNTRLPGVAERELVACAGSGRWAASVLAARPFGSVTQLYAAADRAWATTTEADWREAILTHPRIGESPARHDAGPTSAWSRQEQSHAVGDSAGSESKAALAEMNRRYEERFGMRYIVCATGKSADELVGIAEERLQNDPATELRVVAEELHKITRLRLGNILKP
jgi:allantoicase